MPNFIPFPKGTGAAAAFDTKPIASGPYKVASYQRGSSLKLVRNPHWKAATDTVRAAKPDAFEWTFGLDARHHRRAHAGRAGRRRRRHRGRDPGGDRGPGPDSAVQGAHAVRPQRLHHLHGPEHHQEAARRRAGAPGDQLRRSTRTPWSPGWAGRAWRPRATSIQPPTIAGRVDYDLLSRPTAKAPQAARRGRAGRRVRPHPGHPPGAPPAGHGGRVHPGGAEAAEDQRQDQQHRHLHLLRGDRHARRSSTTRPSPAGARTGRPARPSCRRCSTAATSPTRATRTSPRSTTRRSTSASTRSPR